MTTILEHIENFKRQQRQQNNSYSNTSNPEWSILDPEWWHILINKQPNNSYSSTYNQGWCNHTNFSWENQQTHGWYNPEWCDQPNPSWRIQQNVGPSHQGFQQQHGFHQQGFSQQEKKTELEIALAQLEDTANNFCARVDNMGQSQHDEFQQAIQIPPFLCDFCQGNHPTKECYIENPFREMTELEAVIEGFRVESENFMARSRNLREESGDNCQNQSTQIWNLETQSAQLANLFKSPEDNLPSNTEVSSGEQCQAITLSSGKELELPLSGDKAESEDQEQVKVFLEDIYENSLEAGLIQPTDKEIENEETEGSEMLIEANPPDPTLQKPRIEEVNQHTEKLLPSIEEPLIPEPQPVLPQQSTMPSSMKFIKDSLLKKRKLEEYEVIPITKERGLNHKKKLPQNFKDSRRFMIPQQLESNEGPCANEFKEALSEPRAPEKSHKLIPRFKEPEHRKAKILLKEETKSS